MKYTPATFAKAIATFVVSSSGSLAVSGVALDHLTLGPVLGALGVGLTAAGAVFVTPNEDHNPAPEAEPLPSPLEQVLTNAPVVIGNAMNAHAELQQMQEGLTDALSKIPVIGPELGKLGKQVGDLVG